MKFRPKGRRIYADWAATTPLDPRVARAMTKARALWANPSAIHAEGVRAKKALEVARVSVARLLSAKPDEIFFTSGGTESNVTVIRGVVAAYVKSGANLADVHIVSSSIEHSSILETLRELEGQGVSVTYIEPNENGIVSADEVVAAIRSNTVLVTCMLANNEIGTLQPVSKIGAGIRKVRAAKIATSDGSGGTVRSDTRFPVFHSDASQAPLWLSCDLEGLRVDALTLDAHKMCGPKGIGALVLRHGVPCEPLMRGGGQERGMRPTTESVELVVGFAEALRLAQEGRERRGARALSARTKLVAELERQVPGLVVNGSLDRRLPNNLNISLPNLSDPEFAVIRLDARGIACSTKSSCLKGEESSYVVASLGGPSWRARNTLRFSIDPDITSSQIKRISDAIKSL